MPQVDLYWICVPKGILRHLVLSLFHYVIKMILFFNSEEVFKNVS